MRKTPIQQFIDWMEEDNLSPGFDERYKEKKAEMLKLEKEEMDRIYSYAFNVGRAMGSGKPGNFEGYYNANYTNSSHGNRKEVQGTNPGEGA